MRTRYGAEVGPESDDGKDSLLRDEAPLGAQIKGGDGFTISGGRITDGSIISKLKKSAVKMYNQYELVMGLNIYEPWEKNLLNALVLGAVGLIGYSAYTYLPNYVSSSSEWIFQLFS